MKYLFFDLDGTLCESKQKLGEPMLAKLRTLSATHQVNIVSGAELSRMFEQAPLEGVTYMAQNGNEVYRAGKVLWKNDFPDRDVALAHILKLASYCGIDEEKIFNTAEDLVDDRGAQISFSFVGHHAPLEKKKAWDPDRKKRMELLDRFPLKNAVIGGTTCIDYVPFTKGENIARYIDLFDVSPKDCLYVGDALMHYGNDATVLGVIPVHQVNSPEDTLKFL